MKKLIALVLVLICGLGMTGCSTNKVDKNVQAYKVDKNVQVFRTEDISRITFYTILNGGKVYEVPSEYMVEISEWLGSFTIAEKVRDNVLLPGSNSVSVEIVYKDGTVIENGLSTIKIDEVEYYMEHEDAPQCYLEILEQTK